MIISTVKDEKNRLNINEFSYFPDVFFKHTKDVLVDLNPISLFEHEIACRQTIDVVDKSPARPRFAEHAQVHVRPPRHVFVHVGANVLSAHGGGQEGALHVHH